MRPAVSRRSAVAALLVVVFLPGCGSNEDSPVTPQRATKAVSITGEGSGRVTSTDGKIDCRLTSGTPGGPTCSAAFDSGAVATLNATADADQEFSGWSGACSGVAACQLSVTHELAASAKFVPAQRSLALELTTPNADDGAVIIEISGPNILSIVPAPGIEMVENRATSGAVATITLLVRGDLTTGSLGQMTVRGVSSDSPYDTRVIQAAARASGGYAQRPDLSAYRLTVRRP